MKRHQPFILILLLGSCVRLSTSRSERLPSGGSSESLKFGEVLSDDSLKKWSATAFEFDKNIMRVDSTIIFESKYKSPAFYIFNSKGYSISEKVCNANILSFIADYEHWEFIQSNEFERSIYNYLNSRGEIEDIVVVFCFNINNNRIIDVINKQHVLCDSLDIPFVLINSDNPGIENYKEIYMKKWNLFVEERSK